MNPGKRERPALILPPMRNEMIGSNTLLLRSFMGFTMLIAGVYSGWLSPGTMWAVVMTEQGWLWPLMMIVGGLGMVVPSFLTVLCTVTDCPHRAREIMSGSRMFNLQMYLDFYCGAVWAGYANTAYFTGGGHLVEYMAPVFIFFILLVAWTEADSRRKKNKSKSFTGLPQKTT